MKNKDEIIIADSQHNDDAQAVNESELLPIYNAMHFSGDIQPLEDIKIPDYEKSVLKKERSESKKTDIKKKTNPIKSVFNKLPKKAAVIAVAAVVVIAVAVGVVWATVNDEENKSPLRSVFSVGEDMQMLLYDGSVFPLSSAEEVKASDNGMMLYYGRNTESKTGKLDLRVVDISQKRSIQKEGTIVDSGVDPGWQINAAGTLLCYSKTETNSKTFYIYNAETRESTAIASDAQEAFLPKKGDVVYFTRKSGEGYSLLRMRLGEEHQNVASNVSYVKFCDSGEDFEVLYTIPTGNETNVNVFIVRNFESPLEVCSDVSEVYANEYTYKGNLYYFKKDVSKVSWQDFINDAYEESDITLKKPVQSDYMVEKGFIFKRYVLDEVAYNAALSKYNAKEQRDSIRAALNDMDLGISVENEYSCFVYNGLTNKKLASGVKLDNIVSYSEIDAPRLVYRKSVIAVDDKIKIDELVKISYNSSIDDAVDYVINSVKGSFSLSNDCIYTWYDGAKIIEFTVDDYASDKVELILASSSTMYALDDGKLYVNKITKTSFSKAELIDTAVSDCTLSDEYLYYIKSENPEKPSLLRYSADGGKESICESLHSYFTADGDFSLSLVKKDDSSELANLGIFVNGEYSEVDADVWTEKLKVNGKTIAYLKNIGASDVANSGEMYVYNPDNGTVKLADDVTEILYIR